MICHINLLVFHKSFCTLQSNWFVTQSSWYDTNLLICWKLFVMSQNYQCMLYIVCYSLNIYMIHIHIYNSISQTSWCVANCFVCHYAKLLVHLQTNGLVLQTSWYLANLSDWYMSHNLLLIYHRLFGMSQMFRYMYNLLQASHYILIVTNFCKSNLQTFMSQHTS